MVTPAAPQQRHQYGHRRPTEAVTVEDHQFILQLPERGCGCHPAMPVARTPDGWACQGCGVHA